MKIGVSQSAPEAARLRRPQRRPFPQEPIVDPTTLSPQDRLMRMLLLARPGPRQAWPFDELAKALSIKGPPDEILCAALDRIRPTFDPDIAAMAASRTRRLIICTITPIGPVLPTRVTQVRRSQVRHSGE